MSELELYGWDLRGFVHWALPAEHSIEIKMMKTKDSWEVPLLRAANACASLAYIGSRPKHASCVLGSTSEHTS